MVELEERTGVETFVLDDLDRLVTEVFDGFVVKKDLALRFKNQYPVPTYVGEFLIGKFCASTDPEEIREGLEVVESTLRNRTVRAADKELFKSNARERGAIRIIDKISARLDAKTDSYLATLPSLTISDARIDADLVQTHERLLSDGFYAEITLGYDAVIAQEKNGRPFGINGIKPIQLSKRNILEQIAAGRSRFTTAQWKDLLLRSVGFEPDALDQRQKDVLLLRMVPFVERNYNMVELGPRGTGKSHLFQQVSPYSHLVSGGKATVARMFVNNASGERGLVAQYDVVCFDEVSGISFDNKDGVNIMKGYMESGEFSRGRESIRADGSIAMVGNFEVDVEHQQRVGHLFGPMPKEMRDDTAFMDRLHSYIPGWDVPKLNPTLFTEHYGLVSDVISECWTRLRDENRLTVLEGRVYFGGALSGRDTNAVHKTINGLLKLLYPDSSMRIADEDLEWATRLALECRRRIKEQQKRVGSAEFRNTQFSYQMGNDGIEQFVTTPELQGGDGIGTDPLPPGQVWAISPGGQQDSAGLFRIDVNESPGSGVRITNVQVPSPMRESLRYAEQNLYTQAKKLVGDRDPRSHELNVQFRAMDASKNGADLGLPALIALASALIGKSVHGGMVCVGGINLGGGIEMIYNAASVVELAAEKGAASLLMPVATRRDVMNVSDEIAAKVDVRFYTDARDAFLKAVMD
ncbi:MAG: protease Lon-related BREX system protein BrxL [Thermomicrobiales bacterium]